MNTNSTAGINIDHLTPVASRCAELQAQRRAYGEVSASMTAEAVSSEFNYCERELDAIDREVADEVRNLTATVKRSRFTVVPGGNG